MARRMATAAALALTLLIAGAVLRADAAQPVTISNEFISITVNADEADNGRFGVETTGGDPANPDDDRLALIYGRPLPWTSYTTVRIDGEDWVFGGKTSKRAGREGIYGSMLSPPTVMGKSIVTSYKLGEVKAVQDLSFVRNQMTGYEDTARIAYTLKNEGTAPTVVGLRVLLDTMLGVNDGAPLRAGEIAVVSDSSFEGSAIPDFWQAFDSLTEPSITSQATLKGKDLTAPGRVAFSNWGAFADNLWEIRLVPGRDFTREGEFDLDSAAAMYWDGITLQPGTQVTLVTYYGLGGITVAPGSLSMGLAAPAEVSAPLEGQKGTFAAVLYLQNTGKGPALDVKVLLDLQKGLELISGADAIRSIGDLKQGQMVQLTYQLRTDGGTFGPLKLKISAVSSNTEQNSIERQVAVLSPPRLSLRILPTSIINGPEGKAEDWYRIAAKLTNIGEAASYWNEAAIELTGASLLPGESQTRQLGHLEPNQSYEMAWFIAPPTDTQTVGIKVRAYSDNAKQVVAQTNSKVETELRSISISLGAYIEGFVEAKVFADGLYGVAKVEFDIVWEGGALVPLGRVPLSAGALMLLPDGTAPGLYAGSLETGAIRGIRCSFLPGGEPKGAMVNVDFRIAGPGRVTIKLENVKAWDAAGKQLQVLNDGLKAIIK